MSIKRKLTLMMLGISLAAVMMTVMAVTSYLIYDMRASKQQQLGVTAALTGDRNGAALVFLDNDRAARNLEIFRLNPSILATCIFDAKGQLFAAYEMEGGKGNVACPKSANDIKKDLPEMLTAYEPIKQNGEVVGNVYIASNTSEIDEYVTKIIQISFTITVLVFFMVLLLTVYFQRAISGPILKLAATARKITENQDYTIAAEAVYQDETGQLANAFNNMIGEVRKRDEELRTYNENLEQKVTERTHELEDAKFKAEAASEAKSEFLRNMSHEFRTPLHALISFSAYGIKEHESSDRQQLRQYFEMIQKGAERLSRLVNEVLDLAKLEHGDHRFILKRGDMRELGMRSAELVQPLLQEKNITLSFDPSKEPAIAMCDQDKIVQVITNLLANAVKFTPTGKTITLHTGLVPFIQSDGNMLIEVAVIDEGIGIPEEEKEAIFESFRQSSRTNTGAGGTGLGLAICRGIIEAHGGKIWAENNRNGIGARVTFSIPAAAEDGKRVPSKNTTEAGHENAA